MSKKILIYIYNNSAVVRRLWFWLMFVRNNNYIPNFNNPRTYNEKINYRKNNPKNDLFSMCSDKIAAKIYVAEQIGSKYIIPNYFVGESITPRKIKEIIADKGDCLLKANHNSGPVKLLTTASTDVEIEDACQCVNKQLKKDFGKLQNEQWYSHIKPKVLVEERLYPEIGDTDLKDYKFHMFKQNDGSFKYILEVHFDQLSNHTISYFDENLNWLPITVELPNIKTSIVKPDNFEEMVDKAKILAKPFTHVRVDFYNINDRIYFGELTFAKTSGGAVFLNKMYDLWMGNLWQGDPRY